MVLKLLPTIVLVLLSFSTYAQGVNPFLDTADNISVCPNDGSQLAEFFSCSGTVDNSFSVTDSNVQSVQWQRFSSEICAPSTDNCPNQTVNCWSTVSLGNNYTITQFGEYRVAMYNIDGTLGYAYARFIDRSISFSIFSQDATDGVNGEIHVEVQTGAAPYDYLLLTNGTIVASGTETTDNFIINGLIPGIYDVEVSSQLTGCLRVSSVVINETAPPIALELQQTKAINCTGAFGEITATATGGIPPYYYALNGAGYSTNNVFGNLTAGTYQIDMHDSNDNTRTAVIEVLEPQPLSSELVKVSASGPSEADGSISVANTSGGIPPYMYAISPNLDQFQSSPEFTGLLPGAYTVTIQDSNGCFVVTSGTISATDLSVNALVTSPITCNGEGNLFADVSGGAAPYLYSLDGIDFQSSQIFDIPQPGGTFSITVKDRNGDTTISNQVIVAPYEPIELLTESLFQGCSGDTAGTLMGFVAFDRPGTYQYRLWDATGALGEYQTSNTFENLMAGEYGIEVMDEFNCTALNWSTIEEPAPLSLSYTKQSATAPTTTDGNVVLDATGGTPTYIYLLNGINNGSPQFDNLAPGTYLAEVFDQEGCTTSITFNIDSTMTGLDAVLDIRHISCNAPGGTVAINATGGTGAYLYALDNSDIALAQMNPVFENVTLGNHTAYVFDSGTENFIDLTFVISETAPIIYDDILVSYNDIEKRARLEIVVQHTDYLFSINGSSFSDSPIFENLEGGTYSVQIEDALGCREEISVIIDFMDNDNDGIPDRAEDLNANLDVSDDDTDGDGTPNYLDSDDDDDGIPTLEEDANGNGSPLDDDTDSNGIPDYLEDTAMENTSGKGVLFEDPNQPDTVSMVLPPKQDLPPEEQTTVMVSIFSVKGKTVYQTEYPAGTTEFVIDVAMFTNGLYFMGVERNGETEIIKFLVR